MLSCSHFNILGHSISPIFKSNSYEYISLKSKSSFSLFVDIVVRAFYFKICTKIHMYIQILLQGGIPVYHAVHMWADLYVWSLSCQTTQWHLPSSLWFHTCSGQTRFSLQLYNTWLTVSVATPDWMSKPIAWFTEIRNLGHCDFTNGKMRQLSNVSTTSNVNKFRCWFLNSPQFADWLGRTFFDPGNIPDFSSPYNLWMYPAVR